MNLNKVQPSKGDTMRNNNYLLKLKDMSREQYPNFHDYGFIINKIIEELRQQFSMEFTMYADSETANEIWEVLEEDLQLYPNEVTLLSHVIEGVETQTIASNQYSNSNESLNIIVKPRVNNGLFYYPNYRVALAKTQVYMSHTEMTHDFIFAPDDEAIQQFIQYILKRKRDYIKNHVTVFVDTNNGVETKKEVITNLVNREDVFLEEGFKRDIYRSIDEFFLESGDFFKKYNIPYKRGILLYGKPGNGKTTLVKSIANSIAAPVAYWQITEHTSSHSVNEVFTTVAKLTPMVLVIEDIDSMPEEVRSVFLNILDGATSKEGIFLIGTTNYPEKIDPALINRSGRFDRAYELKLPSDEMRKQYLEKKQFHQFIEDYSADIIASLTKGFSFAQLNELFISVAITWHYEGKVDLQKIITELQADNKKSNRQQWMEENQGRMGF